MALHFNNRCHPSMPSDKVYIHVLEYDGISIHIHIAVAPNLSRIVLFIWGLKAAVPRYTIPPRSQQRDKTVYIISASLSLSPQSAQLATPPSTKATNSTIDIAIYTKELCHSYIDLQPLSQGTLLFLLLLLQSIAVPRAIKVHPSRGAPNDVDSAVTITKEHLLCSCYDWSCRQITNDLSDTIACKSSRE